MQTELRLPVRLPHRFISGRRAKRPLDNSVAAAPATGSTNTLGGRSLSWRRCLSGRVVFARWRGWRVAWLAAAALRALVCTCGSGGANVSPRCFGTNRPCLVGGAQAIGGEQPIGPLRCMTRSRAQDAAPSKLVAKHTCRRAAHLAAPPSPTRTRGKLLLSSLFVVYLAAAANAARRLSLLLAAPVGCA